MKIDAVIFDMDGTLFQTDRILELSLKDTFARLEKEGLWEGAPPIEKYREIMGVPLPKVWETLLPLHSEEVRESVDEHFLEVLVDNIQSGKGDLYPHVKETLAELKKHGMKLFIASNGLPSYLESIVKYYNLDRWLDAAYSIEHVDSLFKSDLVHMICKKHGIKSGAVVGDRLSDITAAKDNGLLAVGCRFDFSQEHELKQADTVIEDIIELNQSIETIGRSNKIKS
jgi:phosphoglycolate phosphatase-like HAD superfamily hydrolase